MCIKNDRQIFIFKSRFLLGDLQTDSQPKHVLASVFSIMCYYVDFHNSDIITCVPPTDLIIYGIQQLSLGKSKAEFVNFRRRRTGKNTTLRASLSTYDFKVDLEPDEN